MNKLASKFFACFGLEHISPDSHVFFFGVNSG